MDASAVIVAAGKSVRANGLDKNFVQIYGKYIVEFSIELFSNLANIKEIVLVLNDDNFKKGEELLSKYPKLKFVKGGTFRAQSVKNGVEMAKSDLVLIHDGARPFIKASLVESILQNLEEFSCVIPVVPVRQTIKEIENGFVKRTPDRTKLFEVQTPEGFKREILLSLYDRFGISEQIFDESILFEMANFPVKTILGLYENFKITTSFDIFLAELMAKTWKYE